MKKVLLAALFAAMTFSCNKSPVSDCITACDPPGLEITDFRISDAKPDQEFVFTWRSCLAENLSATIALVDMETCAATPLASVRNTGKCSIRISVDGHMTGKRYALALSIGRYTITTNSFTVTA